MSVSGPIVIEKAIQFHTKLRPEDEESFKGSSGWLLRFCNYHGIRQLSLQGEKL